MPRRPRIILPNTPLHLIQRGNNRQACFYADEDYLIYLEWLEEFSNKCGCAIHAYVLMTNHVHLLITPSDQHSAGAMMKNLGQRYVQYINRAYKRSGTLWEGRYRSCLTREDEYVLGCYRYIELNPVRANMVNHPAEYRWSSYRIHAQGEATTLITPHSIYSALGSNDIDRLACYRELFRSHLDAGMVDEIRAATNGNFALGSILFKEQITTAIGRRAMPGKNGRPKKQKSQ